MVDSIIKSIEDKLIENLDEGLLMSERYKEDFRRYSVFFEMVLSFFKEMNVYSRYDQEKKYLDPHSRPRYQSLSRFFKVPHVDFRNGEKITVDKNYVIPYLAVKVLNTPIKEGYSRDDKYLELNHDFPKRFNDFWNPRVAQLTSILEKVPNAFSNEKITATDKLIVNVGHRSCDYEGKGSYHPKLYDIIEVKDKGGTFLFTKRSDCKGVKTPFADIFLITSKLFIKFSLGAGDYWERTENIIAKDIKKLAIFKGNLLEIHFHGHYDPETIVLDDYDEAHNLLKHLTELRSRRY